MNAVLMAAFVAASIIALYFYMELKSAGRENIALRRALTSYEEDAENEINDSDEVTAEQSRRSERMLGKILNNTEFLMSTLADVQAEQAITDAKIDAVKTDIETLIAKVAAIPPAGLTPEQQTAIDDIAAHAKSINDNLSAVDTAANPAA